MKFKEAGLESGATETIRITATLEATYSCVNGGNKVPSDPKKTTVNGEFTAEDDFTAARNGNVSGSLSLFAPSASSVLDCPNGQRATFLSAIWSNVSIDDLDSGAHLDL